MHLLRAALALSSVALLCASPQQSLPQWLICEVLQFFLTGTLCLSAGRGVLRLSRLPRHDRGPVPGGIDPRLAVYARS